MELPTINSDNIESSNTNKQNNGSMNMGLITPSPIYNQMAINQFNLMNLSSVLKTEPRFIVCPYCHQYAPTKTERTISYENILLCLCCGPAIWAGSQAIRNKDFNCYNAKHYCMYCNKFLSEYKAL